MLTNAGLCTAADPCPSPLHSMATLLAQHLAGRVENGKDVRRPRPVDPLAYKRGQAERSSPPQNLHLSLDNREVTLSLKELLYSWTHQQICQMADTSDYPATPSKETTTPVTGADDLDDTYDPYYSDDDDS